MNKIIYIVTILLLFIMIGCTGEHAAFTHKLRTIASQTSLPAYYYDPVTGELATSVNVTVIGRYDESTGEYYAVVYGRPRYPFFSRATSNQEFILYWNGTNHIKEFMLATPDAFRWEKR